MSLSVIKTVTAPKTLTDAVYRQLRQDIIEGVLAPDEKLKIERLREVYNTGATPLREALSRLSADGFVITEGQRGFKVTPISAQDLEDVTNLRILLELQALRTSVQTGDEAWESRVVATYYQLSKIEELDLFEHLDIWEQRNHDFHWALISACHSKWLLHFYNILYDQHKRYRNISLVANIGQRDIHLEHERIYQAALARDVNTVCQETEQHIRQTAAIALAVLQEKFALQAKQVSL